jgi:hypothetical protein
MEQLEQEIKQGNIRMSTVRSVSKIELIKFQLEWILSNSHVEINNTQLLTLSYVFLYQEKAPLMLVRDGHIKREKSIENVMSKFRKRGLIQGKGQSTRLHPGITPTLSDIDFTIKFRLNGN